jgi:hypothetical protein
VKRRAVLKQIELEAKRQGIPFALRERTNHTGIEVGYIKTVIGRHIEIDEKAKISLFKQLQPALGKGWWRK